MHRMSQGDAGAYRELSERYLSRVLNFSYRLLRNRAEAEEIAQECFLRLWQTAAKWKANAQVHTWLYRVANNLCVDHLRRRRPQAEEEAGSDSVAPAGLLRRKQTAEAVRNAMATLPERQQQAVMLSHFEDLGNPDIGEVLGVSTEAVESLLSRGRRKLREALEELQGA